VDESLQATHHRCPARFSSEGDFSDALMDSALLRHILGNLLSNAVKYSPAGSPIDLSLRREEDEAVIVIRDHGIGIPEGDQARLYEAFHRASNVGETPGTGLGLLLVKRCVELHHGSIHMESGKAPAPPSPCGCLCAGSEADGAPVVHAEARSTSYCGGSGGSPLEHGHRCVRRVGRGRLRHGRGGRRKQGIGHLHPHRNGGRKGRTRAQGVRRSRRRGRGCRFTEADPADLDYLLQLDADFVRRGAGLDSADAEAFGIAPRRCKPARYRRSCGR